MTKLSITTLEGRSLDLTPVRTPWNAGEFTTEQWLRFIGVPTQCSVSEADSDRIQAFMAEFNTDALSDGERTLTIGGSQLMTCAVSAFCRMERFVGLEARAAEANRARPIYFL